MKPLETIVIAEIGVNWNSIDEAKEMIDAAAEAGATHAKFQAYNEENVAAAPKKVREHLEAIQLNQDIVRELKPYTEKNDLVFLVTPFNLKAFHMLEKEGVKEYKVREKDSQNKELCAPIYLTNKKLFVSTSVMPFPTYQIYNPQLIWMYCVPKYPPGPHDLQLEKFIPALRGYSNHYPYIAVPFYAVCLGAEAIEVHVTLNHNRKDVDADVSLDFRELTDLCKMVCDLEAVRKKPNRIDNIASLG